jgi:glucose-6-phosphate isomerase
MTALTRSPACGRSSATPKPWPRCTLCDLFAGDRDRFARFSLCLDDLLLDYAKNRITGETMGLLFDLAHAAGLEDWRTRMFSGDRINVTENRAVLHVALRNRSNRPIVVDGRDVMADVSAVLAKMRSFSEQVRSGAWRGHTGAAVIDIVNIGIGGSDLGPCMVCEALKPYQRPDLPPHFVSNVDGAHLHDTLAPLDPARTLFVVASKTFTTQETMTNAASARAWLVERLATRLRSRNISSRSRLTPQRSRRSASAPRTCSSSWAWSAAAIPCGQRSGCRSRLPSDSHASRSCSEARTSWTSTCAPRRSSAPCR